MPDLSDVKLAGSFGRSRVVPTAYCGFSGDEATPERTTFLFGSGKPSSLRTLDKALFMTRSPPNSRPERSGSRQERLSTPIPSLPLASEGDDEARWVKTQRPRRRSMASRRMSAHRRRPRLWSEEIATTPANVNDGKAGPQALPDEPGARYSPTARIGERLFARPSRPAGGCCACRVRTGMWGQDEGGNVGASWGLEPADPPHSWHRIEKIFGTWKRSLRPSTHALERGSQRRVCKIRFTAVAYNIETLLPDSPPQPDRCAQWQPPAAQPPKRPASLATNKERRRAECVKNTLSRAQVSPRAAGSIHVAS